MTRMGSDVACPSSRSVHPSYFDFFKSANSSGLLQRAIRALKHAGLSVPGDVSVMGFDNVPFSRYASPALSTIAQDTGKAGRLMVSKLLDSGERASRSAS